MSTPNNPAANTASTLLNILAASNGYVTLAIQAAGVLIPLGKALVQKIEDIGKGTITITFTDLVAADMAELDAIQQLSIDEITTINAELAQLGLPALPAPPNPPIVQSTDAPKP